MNAGYSRRSMCDVSVRRRVDTPTTEATTKAAAGIRVAAATRAVTGAAAATRTAADITAAGTRAAAIRAQGIKAAADIRAILATAPQLTVPPLLLVTALRAPQATAISRRMQVTAEMTRRL